MAIYTETKLHGESGYTVSLIDKEVTIRLTDTDRYKLDIDADAEQIKELADMLTMIARLIEERSIA